MHFTTITITKYKTIIKDNDEDDEENDNDDPEGALLHRLSDTINQTNKSSK